MPFVFYDLETSGLDEDFDQVFQFGGIYTDDDLNQISEINLRCRRRPEVVPSPGAMLVTNLGPSDIEDQPLSHYQMVSQIIAWLTPKCPAICIGHNSLGFDEGFMRRTLYRTLHDPYFTLVKGNARGDTMIVAQAVYHHAPDAIKIPIINGKLAFKLGPLVRENGIDFQENEAHDALADVKATIALARLLKERAPVIWQQMLNNTTITGLDALIASQEYLFLSAFWFGSPAGYAVAYAARSSENAKEIALFDLAYDPTNYLNMDVPDLVKTLGKSPKVIRVVKGNAQPILMPSNLKGRHVNSAITTDLHRERAAMIRSADSFRHKLSEAIPQRYEPMEPQGYVEQQLYEGFFEDEDKDLMRRFHESEWKDRAILFDQFSDKRLRELAKRLICEEEPSVLSEADRDEYRQWVNYRLSTQDTVPWNTVSKALVELEDLSKQSKSESAKIAEIREYLQGLVKDIPQ